MMPVSDNKPTEAGEAGVDYKQKYTALKRKLRFLLYEQECFLEELKKSQRKLLKVSRDKSFLLDRLLQYETVDSSSSDSDATASSDSDTEQTQKTDPASQQQKKKKPPVQVAGGVGGLAAGTGGASAVSMGSGSAGVAGGVAAGASPVTAAPSASMLSTMAFASMIQAQTVKPTQGGIGKISEPPKKKQKTVKKSPKTGVASVTPGLLSTAVLTGRAGDLRPPGHMTREELERHLELKQSSKPTFMSLAPASHSLPDDIFSNENSNSAAPE